MNIYHFMYCFFYEKWNKNGGGRTNSCMHILFVLFIHYLLIMEIIRDVTGHDLMFQLPDFGDKNKNRLSLLVIAFPFFMLIRYYFSVDRTAFLIEKYRSIYGNSKSSYRVFLYVFVPILLMFTLIFLRQGGFKS